MNIKEIGKFVEKVISKRILGISEKGIFTKHWRVSRWASLEDRQAEKVYSNEEALRLFGLPQFTGFKENVLLNTGINELFRLICSTAGTRFDAANAQLGVGTSTTAEAAAQTSLMVVRDQIAWAASTALTLGVFRRPVTVGDAHEFIYEVTTAGTTAATEPVWPVTDGATVTDGTVVWTARRRIWFKGMVATHPTFGTLQRGVWRSQFLGGEANFAWNEFMVRNGATALIGLNRRVTGQGVKVAGHIWELELIVSLS